MSQVPLGVDYLKGVMFKLRHNTFMLPIMFGYSSYDAYRKPSSKPPLPNKPPLVSAHRRLFEGSMIAE